MIPIPLAIFLFGWVSAGVGYFCYQQGKRLAFKKMKDKWMLGKVELIIPKKDVEYARFGWGDSFHFQLKNATGIRIKPDQPEPEEYLLTGV